MIRYFPLSIFTDSHNAEYSLDWALVTQLERILSEKACNIANGIGIGFLSETAIAVESLSRPEDLPAGFRSFAHRSSEEQRASGFSLVASYVRQAPCGHHNVWRRRGSGLAQRPGAAFFPASATGRARPGVGRCEVWRGWRAAWRFSHG